MAFRLILNAAGYKRVKEPGISHHWTAPDMIRGPAPLIPGHTAKGFWVAPNSEWLMGFPRQLNWGLWFRSADFADHNLFSGWNLASNMSVIPWRPDDAAGTTFPSDVAMLLAVPDDPGTPPLAVNMANLATASGIPEVAGAKVIAARAVEMHSSASPFLRAVRAPEPYDMLIFGFGNLALIFAHGSVTLCRSVPNDLATWTREQGDGDPPPPGEPMPPTDGTPSLTSWSQTEMRLAVIPVGWNMVYFMFGQRAWRWKSRDEPPDELKATGAASQWPNQKWWIAARPRAQVAVQPQTMAFLSPRHLVIGSGSLQKAWLDLGTIKPTQPVAVGTDHILRYVPPLTSGGPIPAGVEFQDAESGERIKVQLLNADHAVWPSDGTDSVGEFLIEMDAGDWPILVAGGMPFHRDCSTPQLRLVEVRLPVLLETRPATPLVLNQSDFMPGWNITSHLKDFDGKHGTFKLTQGGAARVRQAGLDQWENYAVELQSDEPPGTGANWVTIYRGWLAEPIDCEDLRLTGADFDVPLGDMTVNTTGLASGRMDEHWSYSAQVLDPLNAGRLEHTGGIEEAAAQSGFDVTDADRVVIATDPAPLELRQLPGAPNAPAGDAGTKQDAAYAPDPTEKRLSWTIRIARRWSGWEWYEDLRGVLWYRPRLRRRVRYEEYEPTPAATIYLSSARAVAAGQDPRQFILSMSKRRIRRVESNFVRVIPSDPQQKHVVDYDRGSINNPLSPNYCADVVRPVVAHQRMAVDHHSNQVLARVGLLELCDRGVSRDIEVNMAPWEIGRQPSPAGVDVGSVLHLDQLGDWEIIAVDVLSHGQGLSPQHQRGVLTSTFTLERLPQPVPSGGFGAGG